LVFRNPHGDHRRPDAGRPGEHDRDVSRVSRHCDPQGGPGRSRGGVLMDMAAETTPGVESDASLAGVDAALRVKDVNHYFGAGETRKQVLTENAVTLMPGEMVIMTGPSG